MRTRWEIPRCRVLVNVLYRIFEEDGPRRLACGVLAIPGDSEVSKCDGMGRKRKHVSSVHVSRAIKVAASAMRELSRCLVLSAELHSIIEVISCITEANIDRRPRRAIF